ncbi:MAG: transglycosylase SLT domain-containing protein [candidate division Zixibacteria bacterium]|nr:transglycosylase SLT domain-containing protein [candidate division Zixibacteria bacterium]
MNRRPKFITLISILSVFIAFNLTYSSTDAPQTDTREWWLPVDLIAEGDYEKSIEVIDSLIGDSIFKFVGLELPGYGRVNFKLYNLLYLQKGYAYYKNGQYKEATSHLIKFNHNNNYLLRELKLYLTAHSFLKLDNYTGAAANAGHYLDEFPGGIFYAEMLSIKAEEEYHKQDFKRAGDMFVTAAECAYDKDIAAHNLRRAAECFIMTNQIERSRENYYKYVSNVNRFALKDSINQIIPTDDIQLVRKISAKLLERRMYRTTLAYLREVHEDDSLIFIEGLCRKNIGHYRTARRLFTSINKLTDFNKDIYPLAKFYAAETAFLSRHYKAAIKEYSDFIKKFPEHPYGADAIALRDIISANNGEKTQEMLEYLLGVRARDRSLGLRETQLLNYAWLNFDKGDYTQSCSLFLEYQKSEDKRGIWHEGLYWAYISASASGDSTRAQELHDQLGKTNGDYYYPAIMDILPSSELIQKGGNGPDTLAALKAVSIFHEKWKSLQKRLSREGFITHAVNIPLALYTICADLGFEELAVSVFGKIMRSDILSATNSIYLANYLLNNARFDEFYELIYTRGQDFEKFDDTEFLLYPPLFYDQVITASAKAEVDPFLVWAIIKNESRFDSDVKSYAGAIGLMQLMPRTASRTARKLRIRLADNRELEDPSKNTLIGTAYLAGLIERYDGNLIRTLAAYNAGPTNVRRWLRKAGDNPDPYFLDRYAVSQTRHYVKKVLNDYLHYRRLWQEQYARL